jgi:HPt (histidine-containing phosphotransfer) domain-containing protein
MAPTPEELQNKLAQIAVRYLDRVGKEMEQLRGMVDAAATGDLSVVREIEALAHRMHGSGAMLQFHEISGHAGALERLAAEFGSAGKIDSARMVAVLGQLQAAIDAANAARKQAAP